VLLVAALAGMAALAGAAGAGDGATEDVRSILGAVRSVAPDRSSFEVVSKSTLYTVEVGTATALVKAEGSALGGISEAGYVLCKLMPESTDPSTGRRIDARFIQVLAIVVGGPFEPPASTAGVPAGVTWQKGEIAGGGGRAPPLLGETQIAVGKDRVVWRLAEAKADGLKKGGAVVVEGEVEAQGKKRRMRATRVVLLAPGAPAAEAKFVFGVPE
jgi:hypothetical protein